MPVVPVTTGAGAAAAGLAASGAAASMRPTAIALTGRKKCAGRRPAHGLRKLITRSPLDLAALAAAGRRRSHRRRSGRCRRTRIVLAVLNISVHPAVVVPVGPDRACDTADGGADHCAFENADARDHRAGNRAESGAAEGAS